MKKITYLTLISLLITLIGFQSCSNKTSTDTTESTANSKGSKLDTSNVLKEKVHVERIDTLSMIILYPLYDKIDLVCDKMPSQKDTSILLCAAGSFTGETLNDFKHFNIAGDHVSNGIRYSGYSCRRNTGAFIYYDRQWKFLYKNYSAYLDSATVYSGCGFAQEMIIHKYNLVPTTRPNHSRNIFRALCEKDNNLCIIESTSNIEFGNFKSRLIELNVSEALYLDMGNGWNHAWYRVSNDSVNVLHPKTHNYCTNWITFYKYE